MVDALGPPPACPTCVPAALTHGAAGARHRLTASTKATLRAGGSLPSTMTAERESHTRTGHTALQGAPEERSC